MPLLRAIHKPRWYDDPRPPWLAEGEAPADVLDDLRTKQNELSVWLVREDESNVDEVVTALATNRNSLDKVDYALIDEATVGELGIDMQESPANTPFHAVNAWHRDLIELSAGKVARLANAMFSRPRRTRVTEARVRRLVRAAVSAQKIELTDLRDSIRAKIEGDLPGDDR